MNTSTLVTLIVGLVIPALTALVTRASVPVKIRALVLLLLSTAAGVISGLVTSPPASLSQWEHVLVNIIATYIAAAASLVATWIPTGATNAIHGRTDRYFGIGQYDPNLVLPAA